MELWDAYDSNFNKIKDAALVRGELVPDGMYHLACSVLVRHTDGTYLITKREKGKLYGGMWEATAGGSAVAGEDSYTCAKRELFEETGIRTENLTELVRSVNEEIRTLFVRYLCATDCDKNKIVLQQGENTDYRWINRSELFEFGKDELMSVEVLKYI